MKMVYLTALLCLIQGLSLSTAQTLTTTVRTPTIETGTTTVRAPTNQTGTTTVRVPTDACSNNPCEYRGICTPTENNGYICTCDAPFRGSNCEILMICFINRCPIYTDCGMNLFTSQTVCLCQNGYSMTNDKRCLLNSAIVDACDQLRPCKNGGSCTNLAQVQGNATYRCNCPENAQGSNCETLLECTATSCRANTDCFIANRQLNCVCKANYSSDSNGNCVTKMKQACINGDPHYRTFDGLTFDYQGTCPYILSKPCGSDIQPYFLIRAQNKQWSAQRASIPTWIELTVHGSVFKLEENFTLTVDGIRAAFPYTQFQPNDTNWKVKASISSGIMQIITAENIEILFKPPYHICVNIPEAMINGTGRLCGLFGDADNDCKNDMRGANNTSFGTPKTGCTWPTSGADGMIADKFGDEWIDDFLDGKCVPGTVTTNGSLHALPCSQVEYTAAQQSCQVIEQAKSGRGVFAQCAGLGGILDQMLSNCAYDICADNNLRCNVLTSLVQMCQLSIPGTRLTGWRANMSCPLTCPTNQYYSDCVSGCQPTCDNVTSADVCGKPCIEGCACEDGMVLDGTGMNCIPQTDCGCTGNPGNFLVQRDDCARSNPCATMPPVCQNNGSCQISTNASKGYTCSCSEQAVGENCEILLECAVNSCPNNSDCSISNRQIVCTCKQGFTKNSQNQCVAVEMCGNQPCQNGSIGQNSTSVPTGNTCICPDNVPGCNCEAVIVCIANSCPSNSDCSVANSQIVCTCRQGFIKNALNQCVGVGACANQPCRNGGTCQNSSSESTGYTCTCPGNTMGRNCETIVGCGANACPNNSECSISNRQIVCTCWPGFTKNSQNDCIAVATCANPPCQNGSTGQNSSSGSTGNTCICPGNALECNCETVITCTANSCSSNSDCSVANSQIVCTCRQGFTKNSQNQCVAVETCASRPCQNGGTCQNSSSESTGYTCVCPPNAVGRNCETVVVCAPNACPSNSDCSVSNRQIVCTCKQGFTKNLQDQCFAIDTRSDQPLTDVDTSQNSTSQNSTGNTTCICPVNVPGCNCITVEICAPNSCSGNSDCSVANRQIVCTCKQGFTKNSQDQCVAVDIRSDQPLIDEGTSQNSTSVPTGNTCICPGNAPSCNCETAVCAANSCSNNSDCSVANSLIVCTCKQGFTKNSQNQCVVAETCSNQPCRNGGTCRDLVSVNGTAAFSCNCPENTQGDRCEIPLNCTSTSCSVNSDCFVQNRQLTCVCKTGYTVDQNGACTVPSRQAYLQGDPHYTTFDGLKFDYQGTCPYIVTQPCGYDINPYFSIRAQNKQWGNYRTSIISWFELNIHGIILKVEENLTLTVNGVKMSVPYTHYLPGDSSWKVRASVAAGQMRITTPENLDIVFYPSVLVVSVPEGMVNGTGRLCGLFGDVDKDCKNDMKGVKKNIIGVPQSNCKMDVDGAIGLTAERFGDDWIDDLQDGNCLKGTVLKNASLPCTPAEYTAAQQACQAIEISKSGRGIFARCAGMGAKLDEMLSNCVYDICTDKNLRCQALTNFVKTCQQTIPGTRLTGWRTNTTCPLTCPANQNYSDCVSGCSATCANTTTKAVCNTPCVEGCTCAEGTVLDGSGLQCIPQQNCGCVDENGNYFETGSTWMNSDCTKAYKCLGNSKLIIKDVTCGSMSICSAANKEYQCSCSTGNGKCSTAAESINNPVEYQLCNC